MTVPPAPHDEHATTIRDARYWLIYYEDADRPAEVYSDEGVARRVFESERQAWNCTLFCEEAALAAARTDNERLQSAAICALSALSGVLLAAPTDPGSPEEADELRAMRAALAASPGAEE